jgi:hypothetical protein
MGFQQYAARMSPSPLGTYVTGNAISRYFENSVFGPSATTGWSALRPAGSAWSSVPYWIEELTRPPLREGRPNAGGGLRPSPRKMLRPSRASEIR